MGVLANEVVVRCQPQQIYAGVGFRMTQAAGWNPLHFALINTRRVFSPKPWMLRRVLSRSNDLTTTNPAAYLASEYQRKVSNIRSVFLQHVVRDDPN